MKGGRGGEKAVLVIATTTPEKALFPSVTLEARAAYVYDVRTGEQLFSKNGDTTLPLASLTKILTALVAVRDIPTDQDVTISQTALDTEGESGLTLGEVWDLADLSAFMLVVSSNDGATALREAYESHTGGSFIAAMNNKAKKLGISARFVNETGLDIGFGHETNAGSAHDIALLLASALSEAPSLLDATRSESVTFTSESGVKHTADNTNHLINDIPWALGAKTGFTDAAGGNLAVAFDRSVGHPVIVVVMGSSREGRFEDVRKLIEATLEASSF
jgi:D-alanyl-D-alanine carboxypeptidase